MARGKEKRKKLLAEATDLTQITHSHTHRQMIYHFHRGRKRLQLMARGKEKRDKKEASHKSKRLGKEKKIQDNICSPQGMAWRNMAG